MPGAAMAAVLLGLCAAVGSAAGTAQPPWPGVAADTGRFDGEYGLMVRVDVDSVRIGWITRAAGPGILQVSSGARVLYEDVTPADIAHSVAIPKPAEPDLLLRYGGHEDAADRHETRIDLGSGSRRDEVEFPATDSLFVIGDIHGEIDTLVAVLRNAGVIDSRDRWAAGRQRLAVVGDMTDRGRDATRVLWFLYGLERQARAAGGQVHVLLAHGGVSADYVDYTLRSFADTIAAFTAEDLFYRWADTTFVAPLDSAAFARRADFFWGPNSVFWYRGYAQSDTLAQNLDAVLDRFDTRLHVVGHTPGATIRQAYGGSLILTNTLPFAAEALLLVRRGEDWARYRIGTQGPPRPLPRE